MKNYNKIHQELLASNTTLVAVSKTKPESAILEMYDVGQRVFGENRVQELTEKHENLPKDIDWHMIGHLQTNKVKYIAPFVKLIHSVDRFKLLKEINKQGDKLGRIIPCLLQFHIAEEDTKFGLSLDQALEFLGSETYNNMQHIRIHGVMGMATFSNDTEQVRNEFKRLYSIFQTLKNAYFENCSTFVEVSMGMSGDYKIAIEEGSTMVRIGSLLFGARR